MEIFVQKRSQSTRRGRAQPAYLSSSLLGLGCLPLPIPPPPRGGENLRPGTAPRNVSPRTLSAPASRSKRAGSYLAGLVRATSLVVAASFRGEVGSAGGVPPLAGSGGG
eukprot:2160500-Rhodomonas_salina.1